MPLTPIGDESLTAYFSTQKMTFWIGLLPRFDFGGRADTFFPNFQTSAA